MVHREAHGPFRSRAALRKVAGLGPKAYELAAGFPAHSATGDRPPRRLGRAPGGLSGGAPHLAATNQPIQALIGNTGALRSLDPKRFTRRHPSACPPSPTSFRNWKSPAATRARPSARRPSRRAWRRSPTSRPACSRRGRHQRRGLRAFVDIGVHQDGLVHISMLADRFVKDSARRGKPGERGAGAGGGGGCGAQADRVEHEVGGGWRARDPIRSPKRCVASPETSSCRAKQRAG